MAQRTSRRHNEADQKRRQKVENAILVIDARVKWYLSGTPFPYKGRSLSAALTFLDAQLISLEGDKKDKLWKRPIPGPSEGISHAVNDKFLQNCFLRHTKQGVGQEWTLPGVKEVVVWVSFSEVEQAIYDVMKEENDEEGMRQVCCHVQCHDGIVRIAGSRRVSLGSVFKLLQTNKEVEKDRDIKSLKEANVAVGKAETRLETIMNVINNKKKLGLKPSDTEEDTKSLCERILLNEQRAQSRLIRRIAVLKKQCEILNNPELVVTERNYVPPSSRVELRSQQTATVSAEDMDYSDDDERIAPAVEEKKTSRDEMDYMPKEGKLEDLTDFYGSKVLQVVMFVKNLVTSDKSAKVIIFSQFNRLLDLFQQVMQDEHHIKAVVVRGNVYQRNKTLASFTGESSKGVAGAERKTSAAAASNDVPILMLSLENAASGANLTGATHVVLMEPVAGGKDRARAIEAQAVGRAHRLGQTKVITVVRFLVDETIEKTMYQEYCKAEQSEKSEKEMNRKDEEEEEKEEKEEKRDKKDNKEKKEEKEEKKSSKKGKEKVEEDSEED
eukprot:TRINITY_DN27119_c0_g1_i2.p1 TRINITY_DN27119_c0_g1~~TRINITY_DN27119_c0_g1_i2.p1  ORF type:complete len:555 (+),score=169.19 TRINITY_DN27119_c0_g1_i2:155-1819(+)